MGVGLLRGLLQRGEQELPRHCHVHHQRGGQGTSPTGLFFMMHQWREKIVQTVFVEPHSKMDVVLGSSGGPEASSEGPGEARREAQPQVPPHEDRHRPSHETFRPHDRTRGTGAGGRD